MKYKYLILLFVFLTYVYIEFNPPNRIGWHGFGYTFYNCIPYPLFDLTIYPNGSSDIRKKSHYISYDEVKKLTVKNPQIIILGIGYNGVVKVEPKILEMASKANKYNNFPEIKILKTYEAVKYFNALKERRIKVGIILHSTC